VNANCFVKYIFTPRINYELTKATLHVTIRYSYYSMKAAAAADGSIQSYKKQATYRGVLASGI
jgi:hypothetical protein